MVNYHVSPDWSLKSQKWVFCALVDLLLRTTPQGHSPRPDVPCTADHSPSFSRPSRELLRSRGSICRARSKNISLGPSPRSCKFAPTVRDRPLGRLMHLSLDFFRTQKVRNLQTNCVCNEQKSLNPFRPCVRFYTILLRDTDGRCVGLRAIWGQYGPVASTMKRCKYCIIFKPLSKPKLRPANMMYQKKSGSCSPSTTCFFFMILQIAQATHLSCMKSNPPYFCPPRPWRSGLWARSGHLRHP